MKEKSTATKLFSTLLAVQTASLLLTLMESLLGGGTVFGWVQKGLTAVFAICLICLHTEHGLYRWSGICWAAVLGITVADLLLSTPEMLADPGKRWIFTTLYWLRLAVSYPATILEYLAYGKTAFLLKKRWTVLLIAQFVWVQLGSLFSSIAMQQYEAKAWTAQTVYSMAQVLQLVNMAVQMIYLWLLFETYRTVRKRDEK